MLETMRARASGTTTPLGLPVVPDVKIWMIASSPLVAHATISLPSPEATVSNASIPALAGPVVIVTHGDPAGISGLG